MFKTSLFTLTAGALLVAGNAFAATVYQFSTTQGSSGYTPGDVSTSAAANVVAPDGGSELDDGAVGLNRFLNDQWSGFSLSSSNGTVLDNATEFGTGYWELTVSAATGFKLDLDSLSFGSARGGSSEFAANLRNGLAFNLPIVLLGGAAMAIYVFKTFFA